jgi:hypothetical protein
MKENTDMAKTRHHPWWQAVTNAFHEKLEDLSLC